MWAVYSEDYGWLVDTCAGGSWDWSVKQAVWFASRLEATDAIYAAEIRVLDWRCVRVR